MVPLAGRLGPPPAPSRGRGETATDRPPTEGSGVGVAVTGGVGVAAAVPSPRAIGNPFPPVAVPPVSVGRLGISGRSWPLVPPSWELDQLVTVRTLPVRAARLAPISTIDVAIPAAISPSRRNDRRARARWGTMDAIAERIGSP